MLCIFAENQTIIFNPTCLNINFMCKLRSLLASTGHPIDSRVVGQWSVMWLVSVCLSASTCPIVTKFCACICYLWPWLSPPLVALRSLYSIYFRFYGWRHDCTQWPGVGDAKKAYTQSDSTGGSRDFTPWRILKLGVWYIRLRCYYHDVGLWWCSCISFRRVRCFKNQHGLTIIGMPAVRT